MIFDPRENIPFYDSSMTDADNFCRATIMCSTSTLAKLLAHYGPDIINKKASYEGTPLMDASMNGRLDNVIFLVKNGARINEGSGLGMTALMDAAEYGHEDIVGFLLEHGAGINNKTDTGKTALMYAAWEGHTEIVLMLLHAGADLEAKDKHGYTALSHASEAVKQCIQLEKTKSASPPKITLRKQMP